MKPSFPSTPWTRAIALIRWHSISGTREFIYSALWTAQGRIMTGVLALAIVPFWQILRNNANVLAHYTDPSNSFSMLVGGVVLGEAALAVGLVILLPILLVKEFVLEGRRHPLLAFRYPFPEERSIRFLSTTLWLICFLWISFHLFFLNLLLYPDSGFARSGVLLHFLAGFLAFLPLGIGIGSVTRLALMLPGWVERARKYFHFGMIPFLLGYSLFLYLPDFLGRRFPVQVEGLMSSPHGTVLRYLLPAGVWYANLQGEWGTVAAWILIYLCLSVWAVRQVWTKILSHPSAMLLDSPDHSPHYRAADFFSGRPGRRWWREFRLFWLKDTVIPVRRNVLEGMRTHGILLTLTFSTVWIVSRRLQEGEISPPVWEVAHSALVLSISALLAMRGTLGRVGFEGRALALLRPVLSYPRLYTIKLAGGIVETTSQAAGYAIAIPLVTRVLTGPVIAPGSLVVDALIWGINLAVLGSALGFLLPGKDRRSLSIPGAAISAKLLFAGIATVATAPYLLMRWLQAMGKVHPIAPLALGLLCGVVLAITSAATTLLTLRSLRRR